MKTIRFNTGRLYSKHGQRITATYRPHNEAEDMGGVVTFMDHDRMVDGEFEITSEHLFTQTVIMGRYDRYQAPATSRSHADGMYKGGCNASVEAEPVAVEPEPEPVVVKPRLADPAPTQVKVDPQWLAQCGHEALADKWLNVTHIRQTTDGPYYTVDLPDGRTWVVAGFRLVATAAAVGNVSPVKLSLAHSRICNAEAALGRLTAGQRRDLVADAFPGWYMTTVRAAADAYPVAPKPREA